MSNQRLPHLVPAGEGESLWCLGCLVTVKAAGAATLNRVTLVAFVNPPRFAPPLHRHRDEDEVFYLLSGSASFRCDGERLDAGPGDTVILPAGRAHTFLVGSEEPLHCLQITTPAGFEDFARKVGGPAANRTLQAFPPDVDPDVLGRLAAAHGIEILGPPPTA